MSPRVVWSHVWYQRITILIEVLDSGAVSRVFEDDQGEALGVLSCRNTRHSIGAIVAIGVDTRVSYDARVEGTGFAAT